MNVIVNVLRYGHPEKVKQDVITLNDIIARQGSSLLLDVIAENCGINANLFKLSEEDRLTMCDGYTNELREAILERV